jgi:hypothetical protein
MATPRYKVTEEKGAYMPRSPQVQLLQLGADHVAARIYGIRAAVCELLLEGSEIEYEGLPGPHLEPLNDEAREMTAQYRAKFPNATLDPTRHMPLGQDPMMPRSFEQQVLGRLDMQLAAMAPAPAAAEDPRIEALLAGTLAMQQMIAKLAEALSPPPSGNGRSK